MFMFTAKFLCFKIQCIALYSLHMYSFMLTSINSLLYILTYMQSLSAKFDEIKSYMATLHDSNIKLDFILICETFFAWQQYISLWIAWLQLFYKNQSTMSRGGVCIYINESIQFILRDDLAVFVEGEFESIFIETTKINNAYHIESGVVMIDISDQFPIFCFIAYRHAKPYKSKPLTFEQRSFNENTVGMIRLQLTKLTKLTGIISLIWMLMRPFGTSPIDWNRLLINLHHWKQ